MKNMQYTFIALPCINLLVYTQELGKRRKIVVSVCAVQAQQLMSASVPFCLAFRSVISIACNQLSEAIQSGGCIMGS